MRQIITLEAIEQNIADMFPGKKITTGAFRNVEFTVAGERMQKDFCIPFKFNYSNVQYVYDIVEKIIFANLQDLSVSFMPNEAKKTHNGKFYRLLRFDKKWAVEIKDEPKLKNKADAMKVWKKVHLKYDEDFKGFFYAELVHALVGGDDGWLVAMKNVEDGFRDILFIRAADGADIRISHAAKHFHYTYLETPPLLIESYLEPRNKK